jgi:hypothetical protein
MWMFEAVQQQTYLWLCCDEHEESGLRIVSSLRFPLMAKPPSAQNQNNNKIGYLQIAKACKKSRLDEQKLRVQCWFDSYAEIHEIFPSGETYPPEPDAMMAGVCKTAKS